MSCGLPLHPTASVLCLYVLGNLHEAHATAIDRHLRSCRRCHGLYRGVENDLADVALALPPVPVPNYVRDSLLHSAREVHRLSDAVPTLRHALQCSSSAAQAILAKVDAPNHWRRRGQAWVMPLLQRPARRALLVRLPPLGRWCTPVADALRAWVLQGQVRCSSGPLPPGKATKLLPRMRLSAGAGPDAVVLVTWRPIQRAQAVAQPEEHTALSRTAGATSAAAGALER